MHGDHHVDRVRHFPASARWDDGADGPAHERPIGAPKGQPMSVEVAVTAVIERPIGVVSADGGDTSNAPTRCRRITSAEWQRIPPPYPCASTRGIPRESRASRL